MVNVIIILAVLAIIGGAALYIYREKKSGSACVGCPHSESCVSHSTCCSNENRQTHN